MRVVWPVHELEREHAQYPGIMNIAALLRAHGFTSEVVPATLEDVEQAVAGGDDVVLAFSTMTGSSRRCLELNRAVTRRHPSVFSVFGGAHPTFFPQMIEEDGVDAVCVGEGEYPMLELVAARSEGRPITSIANLWVKDGDRIHRNPVRPLIEDLDELPLPDRELFRGAVTSPHVHAIVMTGRGCPYNCTYCYNHVYHKLYEGKGRIVRRRSVDHVMRELKGLKDNGCRLIRFMDDVFIIDRDWVMEFAPRYRDEIGLPFTCLVRANMVTAETVQALKQAGCHRMMMGVEAGNERLRNTILKRRMSDEQIVAAGRIIRGAGVRLVTANILGIPGGTLEDDWETLELNLKVRPDYASAALLQAFPGTEIHEIAAAMGLLQEDNLDQLSHGGFGFVSALKHTDLREHRRIENFHKLFPVLVWFPWLRPLARVLIKLPPNRLFDLVYMASYNIGSYLVSTPVRVGGPMMFRNFARRLIPRRRRTSAASGEA